MRKILFIICAVLLFVLLCIYLLFEDTALQSTQYSIHSKRLPDDFDGYTIIQISDYHNAHSAVLNQKLRKAVHEAAPDLIVFTGDIIDRNRSDVDVVVSLIRDLRDVAPMYYVTGNHEALSAQYTELKRLLIQQGVQFLDNKTAILKRGESTVTLLGIDDPACAPVWTGNYDIVNKELDSLSWDASSFSVLLSHRPEPILVYSQKEIDVVFAGHAHGGQIRLPFIGGLFSSTQGFFPKYSCGVYQENQTQMVVSRGIGNSGFPFRIGNRPEIVIVTLRK